MRKSRFTCNALQVKRVALYTGDMSKKPLTDDERQTFIDSLSDDQKNENTEQIFDDAIERASRPKQSAEETPEPDDDYTDIQTRSDTTEDTAD